MQHPEKNYAAYRDTRGLDIGPERIISLAPAKRAGLLAFLIERQQNRSGCLAVCA
jgi:hypothetical protein